MKVTGYKINLDIRLIFSGTNAYLISSLHCIEDPPFHFSLLKILGQLFLPAFMCFCRRSLRVDRKLHLGSAVHLYLYSPVWCGSWKVT